MLNLPTLGASTSTDANGVHTLHFGICLPGITYPKGYTLQVRIIHERDQFVRGREPKDFFLTWVSGSEYDLWRVSIPIIEDPSSNYGKTGLYLYRFQLLRANKPITLWFSDPCARSSGIGTLSAIAVEEQPRDFAWSDADFRVPSIDEMIVYELNVREFNTDFAGVVTQLDYLSSLGVNVLELMPITNVKESAEWGYTPLGYLAPDERLGGVDGLKVLIDACHRRGIAVIIDAVYAHAHPEFAYNLVYDSTGESNPMMGVFAGEFFDGRPGVDYNKPLAREYFLAVNQYWLSEYHLDGFRYDYVPGMYEGPSRYGYADLVYRTYVHSKTLPKFTAGTSYSAIIQCAEHLPAPIEIVSKTYSNCTWQNALLDRSRDMAKWSYVTEQFAHLLDPEIGGYPTSFSDPSSGETFPVAPFQYLESHDHPRFINSFGQLKIKDLLGEFYGDRSQYYKVQPYLIALFTAKGIPMLWNGQEFGENWGVPNWGIGRNLFERSLHWEYFYDAAGKALVRLCRVLGTLRRTHRSLASRGYFYYQYNQDHLHQQVIVFNRKAAATADAPAESLLIGINFSDRTTESWVFFDRPGFWEEQIDHLEAPIQVTNSAAPVKILIPSNYGCIYKWTGP